MQFEFATSNRIIFGVGVSGQAGSIARSFGQRALVVVDSLERAHNLLRNLRAAHISAIPHPISGEPTVTSILQAFQRAQGEKCDLIVSMGGGSSLDTGKAVSALMTNPGSLEDYLEVIGKGQPLKNPAIPFIALPTTAGTGSEVTRNAVIASPEHRVKVSLRSPFMLPQVAIVDPELTYSLPPQATAHTGMDALTQLIEPFTSSSLNALIDPLCREGIALVARCLLQAYLNGEDSNAREGMAFTSLLGGLALANARLGGVHGMANPIGGMCHAPHGAICARLLPLVMETNLKALQSRSPNSASLARYTEVARLLTGNPIAEAVDGITWVQELCQKLDIRPLREYGLRSEDYPELVRQSQKANSMKGNPIPLTDQEILSLLKTAA